MNHSTHSPFKLNLLLSTFLGGLLLASCSQTSKAPLEEMASIKSAPQEATSNPSEQKANQVPESRPQLVKTADISLLVQSIDDTLQQTSQIVEQQQGDVLGLQDEKPESGGRQTASMRMRVPQARLETTLDALAKLGTIQNRTLTAEDVTNQLVDFQARLRNLRQTENSLLQIMNRSGSVGDVLKVAQELSKVRESIEQIDAQLKSLTNRVAYSTINLTLESAVSSTAPQQPLGVQVQDTWNSATHSVGELTSDLLSLAIWLVAYSPYLLILGAAAWFTQHRLKKQSSPSISIRHPSNSNPITEGEDNN